MLGSQPLRAIPASRLRGASLESGWLGRCPAAFTQRVSVQVGSSCPFCFRLSHSGSSDGSGHSVRLLTGAGLAGSLLRSTGISRPET